MREVIAIARAIDIIDLLSRAGKPLAVNGVWVPLGIPRVSCYEIISTLASRGLVRINERGEVELGSRLLAWGGAYAQSTDLAREARTVARKLADQCNETVHVAILDGGDALYVVKEEGTSLVRVSTNVGTRMPAHSTGVGKVLLAYLPPAQRKKLLQEAPLARLTPMTMVNPKVLEREFRRVLRDGVSMDRQESTVEVGCVAAPIRNSDCEVIAAISISMLVTRLNYPLHGAAVREAGDEISARLGWHPDAAVSPSRGSSD
jgi:DNA-binding IclR family transcriptional regulator